MSNELEQFRHFGAFFKESYRSFVGHHECCRSLLSRVISAIDRRLDRRQRTISDRTYGKWFDAETQKAAEYYGVSMAFARQALFIAAEIDEEDILLISADCFDARYLPSLEMFLLLANTPSNEREERLTQIIDERLTPTQINELLSQTELGVALPAPADFYENLNEEGVYCTND